MEVDDMVTPRDVVSEPPTDVQNPLMYQIAVYLLGGIALAGILASAILTGIGQAAPDGLMNVALAATVGLVGLLTRQSGTA